MWLSAANSVAGAAHGFWTAERWWRQQKALMSEAGRSFAQDRASAPKKRACLLFEGPKSLFLLES
jgi:hypothetical protein